MKIARLLLLAAFFLPVAGARGDAAPHEVEMTWMSIANWYFKFGSTRIIMDGYISRVPSSFFVPAPPADPFAFTNAPYSPETANITRVWNALAADGQLTYLLAGHSHFDHTYDIATWGFLTGAPIISGISTCYQAMAQGTPQSQCVVVSGSWVNGHTGERIQLADGVTMRVVRFNHSGNASNPRQHFAKELSGPPTPAPGTVNGFHAGVAEDFPNGGGGRAFLFTIDNPGGKISFFVNNSASAFDLDHLNPGGVVGDIIINGENFGSPLDNLRGALKDAGLSGVDVWIGTGGRAVAQLVVPVLHPKVYIPNHWDGLFNSFEGGMPFPFKDDLLSAYLASQGIQLMPQSQYFDTYRLDAKGVTMTPNHSVKQKLGYSDVQAFDPIVANIVRAASTTVAPDDCTQ
jgi:L-ascorbate metabolism protein UlaG (beta-lactamase superfamily)